MGIFSPTITDYVRQNDLEGVRRRLELGDDVNERRSFQGTPLIEAARYNYVDVMELLIANGAGLELTNTNQLTALHIAIDAKKSDAAIRLAQHGADANMVECMGRTPLQLAIRRNLLEVASVLLAYGADMTIKSSDGSVARDFIRIGPNHELFEQLLDAYTDVEGAISARNPDAIAVCLRELMGNATAQISSIDAAIQLKHGGAVSTILELSLASNSLEGMLEQYKSIEVSIKNSIDVNWREVLVGLGEDYRLCLLEQLMQFGDPTLLKKLVESVTEANWIENVRLSNGWTLLHFATSLGNSALVQYLLVDCGCNPFKTFDDKTPRDLAVEIDSNSEISLMLLQHMKKRTFTDHSSLMMYTTDVTADELYKLVGQMTSVYDLRVIFILGFRVLSTVEMHSILTKAFDEVIGEKLVFDDRAAVFFKNGLQECRCQQLISEVELIEWDFKTTKVNMENSEWVWEIKRSLQEVECRVTAAENNTELLTTRFNTLRDARIQREQCKIKQRTRQRYVSLISSALILCGGSAIMELFGAAFDVWDPAKLLSCMSADHVTDFLADNTNKLLFKSSVEAVLVESAVDPHEFSMVLRDAVKLERGENTETDNAPPIPSEYEPENPLFPTKQSNTRFKTVVLAAIKRRRNSASNEVVTKANTQSPTPALKSSQASSVLSGLDSGMTEEELEVYPYHYAVRYSEGDFDIDEEDGDINQTLTLYVRSTESESSSSRWETVEAPALIYASYLGYVDIVKWFLKHTNVVKTEKAFLTIKRSRNSVNEVCLRTSASSA
ncbi:unnamed protein product [Phytophthora lilii]|uniref:Unnamed protein product n=1 Tax=Phytophthora lilii TaxID=2077276 RepID=A0A9W6TN15_9STRA|nr:unnamed protein product [Phytophthora lilii]